MGRRVLFGVPARFARPDRARRTASTQQEEKRLMNASHITALQTKHATLDQAIAEEMRKAAPDDATLRSLKKQKLRLKEEMVSG